MEYRRFAPGESFVSTAAYHADRERAPHLEQAPHQWRLNAAADLVGFYLHGRGATEPLRVVDLGCGDGGLLSLLRARFGAAVNARGYDFQPSNAAGWAERGVTADAWNFVDGWPGVVDADLYVITEVLEHLEDPHGMLGQIRARGAALVCSSPWVEGPGNIDASHNWAWDVEGYTAMLGAAGFAVRRTATDSHFQVHLAVPRKLSDD